MMIRQSSGKIINVPSTAGINLNPGLAAYAAAKAGMFNMEKSDNVMRERAKLTW